MGTRTIAAALSCLALSGCLTHRDLYPSGKVRREGKMDMLGLGTDQVGEWTYYYESGRLRGKGGYENDVQAGLWTYWHDNGNKEMEGTIVEERREGLWRYFHRNGNPRAQGFFSHGRESGPWTFWTQDGQIEKQGEYSDGQPALRWVAYRGAGAKQSEGCWLEGKHVGTWDFWDENGRQYQKSYPPPAGVELVRENWDDGKLRREGFRRDGKQVGRWTTWHRNGKRRTSGDFTDGTASGGWMAWDSGGEQLAVGVVSGGRPKGTWRIWAHGLETTWNADEIAPPAVFTDWSADDVTSSQSPDQVVMTWLAEAGSEIETPAVAAAAPVAAAVEAPPAVLEQASETKAEVPAPAQPYTKREEEEHDGYVKNYGLNPPAKSGGGGRYSTGPKSGATKSKGDEARSAAMVGKPLPIEQYRCADGRTIQVADFKGKRVLFVVLRGYGSGVCVYCDAQTRALSSPDVVKAMAALGCEVLLVYPGPENGWEAFLEKYQQSGSEKPPYPCLFDPELRLVRQLNLEGNQAIPSSLILDENGVVRFAYVGKDIEDRPSAKRLVTEIKKLCPNP